MSLLEKIRISIVKFIKKSKGIVFYGGLFVFTFIIASSFSLVRVSGSSMAPTYQSNDLLITYKNNHNFNKGDIVIIDAKDLIGDSLIIKRVVATAGDTVRIKNGTLYINEQVTTYPHVENMSSDTSMPQTVIPDGYVFVLGDNRNHSVDSRFFGSVNIRDIKSEVCFDAEWFRNIGQWLFSH